MDKLVHNLSGGRSDLKRASYLAFGRLLRVSTKMTNMKISNKKKLLKVSEFAVVGVATCLNPQAGLLLFVLKLCFLILTELQKDERDESNR
ncbi:MAG: hypothetical protein EAZ39_05010 [Oscillatoriales cyanobacterium]|nr:MAG: hypothetical protein EAZ45_14110 [Oscillatoriales cyanobacterium]TAG21271.1 MAG: hypothetical protein EAZ39_05010 [Oscillatoriales cyanobacterium]TAG34449.1 MAG: hypothetical protein EAZ33_27470 [Oscillatoriales cyanobacterium]TAG55462.1 MAG: hypothetical protein EAZ28_22380 [Oscillatoriales cyanobacterium]